MIREPRAVYRRPIAAVRMYRRYHYLYLMLLLPIVAYLVFRYAPLTGIQAAFKDYNIFKGVWASPWVGTKYFEEAFSNPRFWTSLRNTLYLNALDLVFGFPVPILLAIMLYEMRSVRFKRFAQTAIYLPYFLSWVIIGGIVTQIFGTHGIANKLLNTMGFESINYLMDERNWVVMYVLVGIWQSSGWSMIIYLAAISSVNTELYEAAEVDGCGRIKRILHVTLPCIVPTILIMLILQLGRMVNIGFERPYVIGNDMVRDSSEVISTFVYTMGIKNARYSFSTAVDLFGSVANMLFLVAANTATKRIGEGGLW